MPNPSLDTSRIRAISIDLDDTLWPIWPTITRAESVLLDWLTHHAPATEALFSDTEALRAIRNQMVTLRPDLKGDLSALRRESIRLALTQFGDEPALAERAQAPEAQIPEQPEVRDHDPKAALYGGSADGTLIPERIVMRAAGLLRPGGVLVMEHDISQGPRLVSFAQANGFDQAHTGDDWTGRPRYLFAVRS